MIGLLELRVKLTSMKIMAPPILPWRSYMILVEFVDEASLPCTAILLPYRNLQPSDVCLLLLPENAAKATYSPCEVIEINLF